MGCGPQVGPFPSRPIMGSIIGEGPPLPPTNPSYHLKKERSVLPLKWLLKEDRGRRPTATSAPATAATLPHAAAVPAAKTAASPCHDHMLPWCVVITKPPPSPPLLPPLSDRCAASHLPSSDLFSDCLHLPPHSAIHNFPTFPSLSTNRPPPT